MAEGTGATMIISQQFITETGTIIKIEFQENGFTIWKTESHADIPTRWIIDASLFKNYGEFLIDFNEFEQAPLKNFNAPANVVRFKLKK